jgi:two-component system cell cycle response regulator DivK
VPLILVVDDALDARLTWSELLFDAGYRVALATDGNEALALALSVVPDLVLLDLHMPGLDGWEAARLMRSYSPTSSIPIIALSGDHHVETVRRAMEAGCDRFVTKPCVPDDLKSIIEETLQAKDEKRGVV